MGQIASTLRELSASEKLRYLIAGVWNTFVGLLIFALLWWWFGATYSLWTITAAAHLISTTNSFFVQRRYVFRSGNGHWLLQLARFQLAYVSVLLVVSFFVNAMYVQGMHPVAGQSLAVGLIFLIGFFTGKHFTFSDARVDAAIVKATVVGVVRASLLPVSIFVISLAVFERVWAAPFYRDMTHVGHDFAYAALTALEGKYWIDSNGLLAGLFNPPWFTPAWCSGAAFYADPQASFYSPLQALSLVVDPIFAAYLGTLLFAAVAFWGGFVLARKALGWSQLGATFFAVLGMANAFMPLRSAVGEPAYQPLYLWTILAAALCWPGDKPNWRNSVGPAIAVCACLTAWLQFGFAGMMIPAFLATLTFCLAAVLMGRGQVGTIAARAMAGAVLAVLLNASKLYESASLMRQFPRDFYSLPGFAGLGEALLSIAYSLIQPSAWTAEFGLRALRHTEYTAFPHEWALNFGFGAIAVTLVSLWLVVLGRRGKVSSWMAAKHWRSNWLAVLGIALICLIPLALLWDQSALRSVVKHIPILNSTAWPMRWIVIYLPLMQLLLALPVVALLGVLRPPVATAVCAVASVVIWLGPMTEPTAYYLDARFQTYDPKPVIHAFNNSRTSPPVPLRNIDVAEPENQGMNRNDTMLRGASQALCYNPIYGYRLEALPRKDSLRSGGALDRIDNGQSLIFNPACLVQPGANRCQPGDGFRLDDPEQLAKARSFLARKPLVWERTSLGAGLAVLSQTAFWLLLLFLIIRGWLALVTALSPPAASSDTARDPPHP